MKYLFICSINVIYRRHNRQKHNYSLDVVHAMSVNDYSCAYSNQIKKECHKCRYSREELIKVLMIPSWWHDIKPWDSLHVLCCNPRLSQLYSVAVTMKCHPALPVVLCGNSPACFRPLPRGLYLPVGRNRQDACVNGRGILSAGGWWRWA